MKFRMDKILRFWAEVACEQINRVINLTKRQLLAQILREYEQRGDAMRYLNEQGNIAWKASPRFLTMLADAERDARDDLADCHSLRRPGEILSSNRIILTMTNFEGMPSYFWLTSSRLKEPVQDDVPYTTQALTAGPPASAKCVGGVAKPAGSETRSTAI